MSGVFGVLSCEPGLDIPQLLQRMADTNHLRDWHQTQTWAEAARGVGLGQANIGIFSTAPQPAFSQDREVAVTFFGEISNAEALRQSLQAAGMVLNSREEAELVLRLYESGRTNPAELLEGVFTLAIWDGHTRQLTLANDRFGLLPLYYTQFDQTLLFSPLVAAFLHHPAFPRKLNLTTTAEFLRFQRVLGDKTFFEDAHLLPYSSVLTFKLDANHLHVEHYWDFDHIPQWSEGATFQDAIEETSRLLRESVTRLSSGERRAGVYLSGGLDSRTVLGFSVKAGHVLPSITYGYPKSSDVIYAHQVARKLGCPHYFFPQPDGKWLLNSIDLHLAATEGHTSFIHAHSANTLAAARQLIEVNLTGFNGDHILGARAIEHGLPAVQSPDDLAFFLALYQHFTRDFSWPGPTEAEEKAMFTPDLYGQMRDRAYESLRLEIQPYAKYPLSQRLDYFTVIHQGTRMSNLNVVFARTHFETRYPFCDYRLSEFVFSTPLEYRLYDRLYQAVINREIPKVTWVPRDTDDMLLTDKTFFRKIYGFGVRVKRQINRHLLGNAIQRQQIHGDPENWLRNDLSEWAASILLDKRTCERGIFNPVYIRSIFDRHMGGHEIWTIGKIAPMITFEMMLRRFFD